MLYPHSLHYGAVTGFTGSCHELLVSTDTGYLIDCGLFQDADTSAIDQAKRDALHIDFSLDAVRASIATHVHLDHIGRIPYLLAADFKGPILRGQPSAKLPSIMREDAFHLGFSRIRKKSSDMPRWSQPRIIALPNNNWLTLSDIAELVCRVRLQRAGHALGAAYVEFELSYPRAGKKGTRRAFRRSWGHSMRYCCRCSSLRTQQTPLSSKALIVIVNTRIAASCGGTWSASSVKHSSATLRSRRERLFPSTPNSLQKQNKVSKFRALIRISLFWLEGSRGRRLIIHTSL